MSGPSNLVSDRLPVYSLFTIVLSLIFGFGLIGPYIGVKIGDLFYEGDLQTDILKMQNTGTMSFFYGVMVVQGMTTLIGLILIPLLQLRTIEHKPIAPFFTGSYRLPFILMLVALLGFNFIVAVSPVVEWNADLQFPEFAKGFEDFARTNEDRLAEFTKAVTRFKSPADMLLGLLVIALLPAVGEELVFRGLLQNEFWRGTKNIHVAIWTSAFIFSAIHMQFYGFVPRMLLGALFGYLYYWSGNLLVPMFAHFFNNGFSVIAVYLQQHKLIDTNVEDTEAEPWVAVLFCIVLTTLLLVYLWRFFRQHYARPGAAAATDFE